MKYRIAVIALLALMSSSCKKSSSTSTTINYPTDQLVSYFNFDNNLKDQKGNTPDGTNNGGATFVAGKSGQAISFNGVDQTVTFTRKTFKSGDNVSVSLWFKTVDTVPGVHYFMLCSDFAVFTEAAHFTGTAIATSGGTNNAEGAFTPGSWTHLVGTFDGTNIKVYINGVLTETTNWPGSIFDANRFLSIGVFGSLFWEGSVDDLFIYSKVLSQTEVTQLYSMH